MPYQSTSMTAYIDNNFQELEKKIITVLAESGRPMTRREVLLELRHRLGDKAPEYGSVSGRVTRLIELEMVKVVGTEKNTTGKPAGLITLVPRTEVLGVRLDQ